MIPFDITKLEVRHMYIKMVSAALGGMITVVDEETTTEEGKEEYKKIRISLQLARFWKKQFNTTRYLKPVLSAVTFYGDHVVALERHPLGNLGKKKSQGLFGEVEWISESETNLDKWLMPMDKQNDFMIDGSYLFTVDDRDVIAAQSLSKDGKFKAVAIKAIKLQNLALREKLEPEIRTALMFTPKNGKSVTTPPIWKTLANVGTQQLSKLTKDDIAEVGESIGAGTVSGTYRFDEIDQHLSVNLGFALKAGRELCEVFGYDVIEPLAFDDLMIQMRTVNLPNIANEVKQTYDTGFPFTHAVAWLIGLTNRTQTLESYMTLRSLLKHLTTKGVYRRGAFDGTSIFKDVKVTEVPLKSLNDAAKKDKIDTDTALQMARIARIKNKSDGNGGFDDAA